jgi:hypothetical protein
MGGRVKKRRRMGIPWPGGDFVAPGNKAIIYTGTGNFASGSKFTSLSVLW